MNNKTTRNSILLLVTAAVWGAAFVAQTVGGQTIGAYSFNCVRCIIGVLVLIPVMKFLDKKDLSPRKPQTKEDYKLLIKGGICCGVALCISTNLQQVGILMGASAANQQGGILHQEAPIDISNIAYVVKGDKTSKIGYDFKDGKKVRVAKATGEVID